MKRNFLYAIRLIPNAEGAFGNLGAEVEFYDYNHDMDAHLIFTPTSVATALDANEQVISYVEIDLETPNEEMWWCLFARHNMVANPDHLADTFAAFDLADVNPADAVREEQLRIAAGQALYNLGWRFHRCPRYIRGTVPNEAPPGAYMRIVNAGYLAGSEAVRQTYVTTP